MSNNNYQYAQCDECWCYLTEETGSNSYEVRKDRFITICDRCDYIMRKDEQ